MSRDLRDVDESSRLDKALLAHLPEGGEITAVTSLGLSEWCNTYRIDVRLPGGGSQTFFQKEALGENAKDLISSNWSSEPTMHRFIPEYVPQPIAAGPYDSIDNGYFFVMEWVDMMEGDLPIPEAFIPPVVALHENSWGKSPDGRFGATVNSWFGSLCLPNGWKNTWEEWWTHRMTLAFEKEKVAGGPLTPEDEKTVKLYLGKVLPRYIRPMESRGRSITPCLVHTDLWPGNFKLRADDESCVIFDSNPIWGHNELELATLRNPRYGMGAPYIQEYRRHIPPTEPLEDADDRLVMYMIGHQVYLATIYPDDDTLRNIWRNSTRRMVNQVLEEEAAGKPLVSQVLEEDAAEKPQVSLTALAPEVKI